MSSRLLWALGLFLVSALQVAALECRDTSFESRSFSVCSLVPGEAEVRLWLRDETGTVLGSFRAVDRTLADAGETLAFAMNAGMYHDDRRPVGLYVEEGEAEGRLITSPGPGNFGLLPNGVFCVRPDGSARVIEARRFASTAPNCAFATQSGPMLVIDGDLHPRFLEDSESRFLRNGVGVTANGTIHFAISNQPVTFHQFGRFFRDELGTPNALFFDGNVSRLHAPELGRSDPGRQMGPIVGVVIAR